MKINLSPILVCFAFLICFKATEPVSAQQKQTRILIWADTIRVVTDSLAKLWIAPSIDSNRVSKNWSSLRKGLSQQSVRNLLGRPTSIKQDLQNAFTYWWYGREAVVFNSHTRKVAFWDK